MHEFIFWQTIVSPHMVGLAKELVTMGCKVSYICGELIREERKNLGWSIPDTSGINLVCLDSFENIDTHDWAFNSNAIHLTQGIRGNAFIDKAKDMLQKIHARWGVMMETVMEPYGYGWVKRFIYSNMLRKTRGQ